MFYFLSVYIYSYWYVVFRGWGYFYGIILGGSLIKKLMLGYITLYRVVRWSKKRFCVI